ncbi:MAG: hypothetical protein M1819_004287 [Sarea resinae]|nr:MAG: hypothetical protein M1819_004287 [Sarea resinae]
MSSQQANEAEKNIEIWKVKKLIKRLEAARGNGTSMISLIIPPKDQVSRSAKMLAEEYGTASNIKSRVNRLSVLSAITSTQQKLKLYSKVPTNGLVIYCGEIITSEGKERKINIDFEPFKPINTSLYLCDNKFHTEALSELLESDQKFGFIIMDGNGALFGTLSGNTRDVVHKFSVDLPKKHGRGGQSALRFARLREEKRHNYVRKVSELAVQNFITNDKVNCAGLILAGSADFKNDLNQSDMFDQRLQSKVIKVVDVSYGGENGFNQAIELAAETLSNVKFIQEKKLIGKYFDEISQDSGKVCYGVDDTLKALEAGAAETLIVYENLEITRWVLKSSAGSDVVIHTTKAQESDRELFMDKETGQEMEVVEQGPFLEWLAEHYHEFGATLEFVSDRSSEGNQFVKGFGGIGAILRYKLNFEQLADFDDEDEFYDEFECGNVTLEIVARLVNQDTAELEGWSLEKSLSIFGFRLLDYNATLKYFQHEDCAFEPQVSIQDIFEAVQAETVWRGVVPFENSTNGSVVYTLDLFADRQNQFPNISVCGEVYLDVHHYLLGHAPSSELPAGHGTSSELGDDLKRPLTSLDNIKYLYSHPQAFGQCEVFLSRYLKGVERQEVSSTSKAAELVMRDTSGSSAAIASKMAGDSQGLDFLAKDIEDREDNTTRFLVLKKVVEQKEQITRQGGGLDDRRHWKTLVSFTIDHRVPGALADALMVFKTYDLSLTNFNSRPSGVEPWNYIFFVEFGGSRQDDPQGRVESALQDLGRIARAWRWLGSWRDELQR